MKEKDIRPKKIFDEFLHLTSLKNILANQKQKSIVLLVVKKENFLLKKKAFPTTSVKNVKHYLLIQDQKKIRLKIFIKNLHLLNFYLQTYIKKLKKQERGKFFHRKQHN